MKIEIKCHSKDTLPFSDLTEFQGNLKERTISDTGRLIASIKQFIDGHGRLEALAKLESDGYDIPPLPVVYVKATSQADLVKPLDEAKSLLLHVNSLYVETNQEELLALIEECGTNMDDLSLSGLTRSAPEFNLESFVPPLDNGLPPVQLPSDRDNPHQPQRMLARAGTPL